MEEKKAFVLVQIKLYLIWDKITSQKFDLRDFLISTSHNFLYVEVVEQPQSGDQVCKNSWSTAMRQNQSAINFCLMGWQLHAVCDNVAIN